MEFITTFNALREAKACTDGYKTLAKHLDGVDYYGADTPINLLTILDSNGLDDTLWCFRALITDDEIAADRIKRLIACDFAESVLHIFEVKRPKDGRVRKCIEVTRKFANGEATDNDRNLARKDAIDAATAAADDDDDAASAAAAAYASAYAAAYADAADAADDAYASAADAYAYAADDAAAAAAAHKSKKKELAEIVKKYLTM